MTEVVTTVMIFSLQLIEATGHSEQYMTVPQAAQVPLEEHPSTYELFSILHLIPYQVAAPNTDN